LPLFLTSHHHDTLQAIESSGLLPFDGDVQGVTKKTESFKDHDEAITRNLSHILLLAMKILHGMHGKAKHALFGEGSRQAVSASLSELLWLCSLNIYSTPDSRGDSKKGTISYDVCGDATLSNVG